MSELSNFLTMTGRTLSQMALYSPEHPTVKGAIEEAHKSLITVLQESKEVVLSISEGSLIVNGQAPEGVAFSSIRPFVGLLNKFNLHSMTFESNILREELIPFFQLAYEKNLQKDKTDVGEFLREKGAVHIKVNQARYAKIGEDETVGGSNSASMEEDGQNNEDKHFRESLEELPLDDFLSKLIDKSVKDPKERKALFNRVSELIRQDIQQEVEKQTKQLRQEKIQATQERERVEGVVENAADGVVVVDEAGKVLMMNSAAEEIYGVQLSACIGKPLWEGVKKEQMISLAKDLTLPIDRPLTREVNVAGNEETQRTLRASTASVQDPNGRIVGMVSVLSDVTKQKELNRLQNEFMANVTHDLRSPIHTVKLAVSAILEGSAGPVSPEQVKMLSMATKNVDRLARLINDLLDFSQIESGKMRINPLVTDIGPLLSEAAFTMEGWAKKRQVAIVYESENDLSSVFVDSDRILQIINNLLSNAIKFTPNQGKVVLRAYNTEAGGKHQVRIEVEDNGPGISKEDQEKIFKRFVQLQTKEQQDVRGTGLGLSICQALVAQHKGKLTIQSPPKNFKTGTLFWFELPSMQGSSVIGQIKKPAVQMQAKLKTKKNFWKRIFSGWKKAIFILFILPSFLQARPYWGTVRRVIEGDRIQLQDGTEVRYLGIDAPNRGNTNFSEAKSANRGWVEKKEVQFKYGLQERDAEGVWQAYVFVDGVFVNLEMVRGGHALVARLAGDEEHLKEFLQAEREAHKSKRGLWKDTLIEPYAVRSKNDSNQDSPWANKEEIKKGFKDDSADPK